MDVKSLFNLTSEGLAIKLLTAIAIILIGLVAARIMHRIITKILQELELNRVLKENVGIKIPLEEFLGSLTKYLVYIIAVIWALAELGLQTIVLYIVLVLFLIVIISFIILAFKDFIPNITAGLFIHQKNLFKVGDKIKVKDIEGEVISLSLVETVLKVKNDTVYIPNSILTKNEIIKKERLKRNKNLKKKHKKR